MSTNKKQKKNREPQKEQTFLIINNVFKFDKKSESYANWKGSEHPFAIFSEGVEGFDWPEFKTDRLRIKANTQKFKDHTIVEAFEERYNVEINTDNTFIEQTPVEPVLGGTLLVDINSDNGAVSVNCRNIKSDLYSMTDLHKYQRFKTGKFSQSDIPAKITDIRKHEVRVNILDAFMDNFVQPRLERPWIQRSLSQPQTVTVKDLKLTRGGFLGKAVIEDISYFVGEEYTVDAFIPGSQIVLNITDDFEKFEGKTVKAFVVNYIHKPEGRGMSLVCSVKEYLKYLGEVKSIELFKTWCDDDAAWQEISKTCLIGKVTGIINSSKKCGVFVEIPDMNITGLVQVNPKYLNHYRPGMMVNVVITGFEDEVYYNANVGQMQHVEPYKITNNCIEKCSLKPVLEFVADAA